jgi:hypothetical protein
MILLMECLAILWLWLNYRMIPLETLVHLLQQYDAELPVLFTSHSPYHKILNSKRFL